MKKIWGGANIIRCCNGCTERHKYCHGSCEKYFAERKEIEDRKMKKREDLQKNMAIESVLAKGKRRK